MANSAIWLAIQAMTRLAVTTFVSVLQRCETNRQERRTGFGVEAEIRAQSAVNALSSESLQEYQRP